MRSAYDLKLEFFEAVKRNKDNGIKQLVLNKPQNKTGIK